MNFNKTAFAAKPLKKSLILATGLTMASAVAMQAQATAEPELKGYASMRLGIDSVDAGTSDDGANGRDYLSRIGVKGSMELDDGLTGVMQLEYGVRDDNLVDVNQNGDPTLRLANV